MVGLANKITMRLRPFCDATGIGPSKVYELIAAGEIESVYRWQSAPHHRSVLFRLHQSPKTKRVAYPVSQSPGRLAKAKPTNRTASRSWSPA
jgi:hypothetical protein